MIALRVFRTMRDGLRIDNTRRVARILSRRRYYWRFATRALGRIPMPDMLRSHFAFQLADADAPSFCTVEFTNYCNLGCTYCTSPLGLRDRGMMPGFIFDRFLSEVERLKIARVRIVGNGEPTLHPKFSTMVRRLGAAVPFLQMVTNGHRLSEEAIDAILKAPVRLLEISVDGRDQATFERTRVHGSIDAVLETARRLRSRRRALGAATMINFRVMIGPDQRESERELLAYWRGKGDSAMPQYVVNIRPQKIRNAFMHAQREGDIPKCSVTLKTLNVLWNGNVPVCGMSSVQTGLSDGVLIGNIGEDRLGDLWRHPLMQQYRNAHRRKIDADREMCRGCVGG